MNRIKVIPLFCLLFLQGCFVYGKKDMISLVSSEKPKADAPVMTSVQVLNNQIVITGRNLNSVSQFDVKDGATTTNLQIESKTDTSIVANTLSNMTFAAGRILDFVLSSANAAATFTVNFSLCDSTLGGKVFNCTLTPTDKDVLSYDATTGKWAPRQINGLAYQGTYDASTGVNPTSTAIGDYYIIGVGGTIGGVTYSVGDWIVLSAASTWERINNSNLITSVFGRTGAVVATKGDYVLTKMGDVDLTTVAPVANQYLKYNGTNWVPGTIVTTESDPTVSAFAKAALPTCGAGQVLKGDGTNLSCVASSSTDVLAVVLTGLSTATNAVITAADSVLSAFGKLQKQITDLDTAKLNKTGGTLSVGTINGVPTPTFSDDIVNKAYVDLRLPLAGGTMTGALVNNTTSASTAVAITQAGTGYAATFMGGNVGIGTTTPGTPLEVSGVGKLTQVQITDTTAVEGAACTTGTIGRDAAGELYICN